MKAHRRSILFVSMACLVVAYVVFLASVGRAMRRPPEAFGHFMSKVPMPLFFVVPFETMWTQARRGALQVGDQAPDFNLPLHDKSGYVRLSSFRGQKAVVLVFGSYT
jgi:hypothetical protein